MVGEPSPGSNPDTKCDLYFGQGALAGTGPRFHKPGTIAYHHATGSLFFQTTGGGTPACPSTCSPQVVNQILRAKLDG